MKYVTYLRVSTRKQGNSGLGLAAQQSSIDALVALRKGKVLQSFTEVESGKNNDRP